MKKLLAILVTILLVGCESAPKARWYKNGVSSADVRNEHAECVYKVGISKVAPTRESELIRACMISKGFRWGIPRR